MSGSVKCPYCGLGISPDNVLTHIKTWRQEHNKSFADFYAAHGVTTDPADPGGWRSKEWHDEQSAANKKLRDLVDAAKARMARD